jgi:hypothetical protein
MRHCLGTDLRPRAWAVLDDDRLTQVRREFLPDQPSQQVIATAGGERHHDLDRPRGIVVCGRARRAGHQQQQCADP